MVRTTLCMAVSLLMICATTWIACRPGNGTPAKKVTLKFSTWGSPEEMTINRRILDAFMADNPDIDVDVMHIPGSQYNTKIQILFAAKVAPDVMWMNAWNAYAFFKNGKTLDLGPLIEEERRRNPAFLNEPDSLIRYVMNSARMGDKVFLSPLGPVTFHLYYNKDLFDQQKLPYPNSQWTWDDLAHTAKKLTIFKQRTPVQYGLHFFSWWGCWLNFVWQNGGDLFDNMVEPTQCLLDRPEALASLQYLQDLIYQYKAAPSPLQMPQLGGDFMTGKIAMQIEGSWMTEQYRFIKDFKWGMAPLPRERQLGVAVRVCGHVIRADSQHPREAWRLVRFYQSEKAQRLMGDFALWIPSREAWARDRGFWNPEGVPPNHAEIRISDIKKARPGDVLHLNANKICETILPMELDRFWLGQRTAEESVRAAMPKIRASLAETEARP